ncbi:hypothetical protein PIB30_049683 [Stylosanthes scabra]|uniref:Replication factor A C-terminal domain-containing protein n=1 Tax=Stylosanthes scabra TaxID=79078 RepID=A0ABU6WH93_9FABA|nr:hypothetical protein [Stylosanthes scabra]
MMVATSTLTQTVAQHFSSSSDFSFKPRVCLLVKSGADVAHRAKVSTASPLSVCRGTRGPTCKASPGPRCRPKGWRMALDLMRRAFEGKTSVQSHFQYSKLHIDPNLNDVKEFKTRLIGDTPSSSVRIAQVSSQGGSFGVAELRRGTAVVKTIEDVMSLKEEGQVWIVGCIMSINAGENNWCYPACTECEKKVEEGDNGKYKCKKCEIDEAEAELKYKVEVVACDGTGGISLILWDTHGLRDEEYPETLDSMIYRRLLFRIYVKNVHVKGIDNVYSVAAICDDEDIVNMNFPNDFEIGTPITDTDNGCSNEVNEDSGVVTPMQNNEADAILGMMDESITSLKCKSTGKRSAASMKHCANLHQEQEAEGQNSTNRNSRKGMKRGKMQQMDNES